MAEIITALAFATAIFMGVAVGASSVSPAFGPVNSAGSANVLRAALVAGIFALLGSVFYGQNVTDTIGGGIVIGDIGLVQGTLILFIGAILVIVSVLTDYPMPTAFTVTGAVMGSAIGFGQGLNFSEISVIVAYWIGVPIAGVIAGYLSALMTRRFLPEEGSEGLIRALLLVSGCYMAYMIGAGSVGLAVGPLQSMDLEITVLLVIGGLAIMAGSWMYSPRIIKAVSYDYSNLGPRRSIAALASAGLIIQAGVHIGAPVTGNATIIATVIGSGMVIGKSNMGRKKIILTAGAWIGAFFLSILLTAIIGYAINF